jgi:hypothetical protein
MKNKNEDMLPNYIFITGAYRSGTTLLEKLLHSHPGITLGSQPFPLLYFKVKEAFYSEKGIIRRYPLDHLFLEDAYTREEFHRFLDRFIIPKEFLDDMFREMKDYIGLWTPEILQFHDKVKPGTFFNVYRQLNDFLMTLFPKELLRYVGGKEILCEEYIPYLLEKGVKVIVCIRDPRDMISSLNFRQRDNQTGENRPILYSLRIWRKSAAFALEFEGHPGFKWLCYEDLVNKTMKELNRVFAFLSLPGMKESNFNHGIYDQHGKPWMGNSSFDDKAGVSSNSIGKSRELLPENVITFIENTCYPEMKVLGYKFYLTPVFNEEIVREYRDPFEKIHGKFPADYSHSPANIKKEIKRFKILKNGLDLPLEEKKKWFLNHKCWDALSSVISKEE